MEATQLFLKSIQEAPGSKIQVLVVEERLEYREAIERQLLKEGFCVELASSLTEGIAESGLKKFPVILLSHNALGTEPIENLKSFRRYNNQASILVATEKEDFAFRLAALKSGADEYLINPITEDNFPERLKTAIFRRHLTFSTTISVSDLCIDPISKSAKRNGSSVMLTSREYSLLWFLAKRKGKVVSRQEIQERVFESAPENASNIVEVYIGYLRKKIESKDHIKLVHTIRGRGYMLGELESTNPT